MRQFFSGGKVNSVEKKEIIWLSVLCILCLGLHIGLINQFVGWFCTDVDGYWLHAATLTGEDWSGVAGKVSMYYAWGYSIILMIPMLLADDILTMSQIAVVLNCFFCTLTIPLLYSLGKKIFPDINKRIVMLSAFITSLYSSFFLLTTVALAEVFIYFLYVLLLWLVWKSIDTEKWYWEVLAGVCCGYLYISHHRNIGIVLIFVLFSFAQMIRLKSFKHILCYLLPLAICIGLDIGVNEWLEIREMGEGTYVSNTYSTVGKKTSRFISASGVLYFMQGLLGEIWYFLIGTFSIAGLGIVYFIRDILKNPKGEKLFSDAQGKKALFVLFALLNVLIMMVVTIVFFARTTSTASRIDIIFYGRYFECTVGIFLFTGLIALGANKDSLSVIKDFKFLLLLTACLSLLVHFFTKEIGASAINYFSVAAVLFPFSHPNQEFAVITTAVCLLAVAAVIMNLFADDNKAKKAVGYVVITLSFFYIGINGVVGTKAIYRENASIVNYPIYNEEFGEINNYLNSVNPRTLYVYAQDGYVGFSFQLFQQDAEVITVFSQDEIEAQENGYLLVSNTEMLAEAKYNLILETTGYRLYEFRGER